MTETLYTLLQWLIPSGSLATVVVWLTNKTLRNLRSAKEIHDTYKTMYEDVKVTLTAISDENKKLFLIVARFERAVSKAPSCRYFDNACPVSRELRNYPEVDRKPKGNKRQRGDKRNTDSDDRAGTGIEGGNGDPGGEPP